MVFESTGLTAQFAQMLESLKGDYNITSIGIWAPEAVCLQRVRSRDRSIHIDVSDDQVRMINKAVAANGINTDFRIENHERSESSLLQELEGVMPRIGAGSNQPES